MSTILLVEDNHDMQSLLREVLEWGGHNVLCGRTGEEGLEALMAAPAVPEVIISDLTMPTMDGMDFLRHVRGNPAWSQIRFIMMSANPHDNRLQETPIDGLDGILPKPFTLDDLDHILTG